ASVPHDRGLLLSLVSFATLYSEAARVERPLLLPAGIAELHVAVLRGAEDQTGGRRRDENRQQREESKRAGHGSLLGDRTSYPSDAAPSFGQSLKGRSTRRSPAVKRFPP